MTVLDSVHKYSKAIFSDRGKLIVMISGDYLWLALFRRGKFERHQKFLMREADPATLRKQIAGFLGSGREHETTFILPRSEILQKPVRLEIEEEIPSAPDLMKRLEGWLEQSFPFRPEELVYGFIPKSTASLVQEGALMMALPEKRLTAILDLLAGLNIRPVEILSEDQLLAWTACGRFSEKNMLCFDQNPERLLVVSVSSGVMKFSRSILKSAEAFSKDEVFQEISLNLIESEGRCELLLYSGLNDHELGSVRNYFNLRTEPLVISENPTDLPALVHGIRYAGSQDAVSLLPRASKLAKFSRQKKKERQKTVLSFLVFTASLVLWCGLSLSLIRSSAVRLEAKASTTDAGYAKVRRFQNEIIAIERAEKSKRAVLELLCLLSEKMPAGTTFRELSLVDNRFTLRAETASHGIMAGAVQSLEKINTLTQVKLDTSRLRKRTGEDFYEFEVSAKWQMV